MYPDANFGSLGSWDVLGFHIKNVGIGTNPQSRPNHVQFHLRRKPDLSRPRFKAPVLIAPMPSTSTVGFDLLRPNDALGSVLHQT